LATLYIWIVNDVSAVILQSAMDALDHWMNGQLPGNLI